MKLSALAFVRSGWDFSLSTGIPKNSHLETRMGEKVDLTTTGENPPTNIYIWTSLL
jgi:hypothetical protein